MSNTYENWCMSHLNISQLSRKLRSSLPEQYIGFYLQQIFGDEIEYQKQFEWLGKYSLDIFIPSLNLAIEYDGMYFHKSRKREDAQKSKLCRLNNIKLIRIQECMENVACRKGKDVVYYFFDKRYNNIDNTIYDLLEMINTNYNMKLKINIDIQQDKKKIVSYVQRKVYKKTIAYVWPEVKDYWCEYFNENTIFDVFYTDNGCYRLQCPHCRRYFWFHMRYFHNRKSLIPCECELNGINLAREEAIMRYIDTGETIIFDDTLEKRRLYDNIISRVRFRGDCCSKEEINLYRDSGIISPWLQIYLSQSN